MYFFVIYLLFPYLSIKVGVEEDDGVDDSGNQKHIAINSSGNLSYYGVFI